MKSFTRNIIVVLILIQLPIFQNIGYSKQKDTEFENQKLNTIVETLAIQLDLSFEQIIKVNQIYIKSTDTSKNHIIDLEKEILQLLSNSQKEKFKRILKSKSIRKSIKYRKKENSKR